MHQNVFLTAASEMLGPGYRSFCLGTWFSGWAVCYVIMAGTAYLLRTFSWRVMCIVYGVFELAVVVILYL